MHALDVRRDHPLRADHREPGLDDVTRQALLDEGRDVLRRRYALCRGHPDRAQRAALQVPLDAGQRHGPELYLAADQVGHHRTHSLVRHVRRLRAGFVEEHRAGQVQDRPAAAGGVVELARLGLEQGDELFRIGRRHLRIDHQDNGREADDCDRRDVVGEREGQRLDDAGEDHHVVRHHAERHAVGRGACERLQADDAAGAGLVLYHHRHAERLGERRLRGAGDGVDAGAGRVGQDEADCLFADLGQRRSGCGQRGRHQGRDERAAGDCGGFAGHRVVSNGGHSNGFRLWRVAGRVRRSRCRASPAPRAAPWCARHGAADPAARRGARPPW